MDTRAIRLDDQTLAQAAQLAASRNCTIEELLRSLVAKEIDSGSGNTNGLVGFLSDEPELADQIMEDVYRSRATQSQRTPRNGSGDS